jgi:hypothetical protein
MRILHIFIDCMYIYKQHSQYIRPYTQQRVVHVHMGVVDEYMFAQLVVLMVQVLGPAPKISRYGYRPSARVWCWLPPKFVFAQSVSP